MIICCPTKITTNSSCSWTGSLASASEHLRHCQNQRVQCLNDGCSATCLRKEMPNHLATCEFQEVSCIHPTCTFKTLRKDLAAHTTDCVRRPTACPNDCGHSEPFEEMVHHLQYHCMNQEVLCPLTPIGCSSQCGGYVKRIDLQAHVAQPCNMMAFLQRAVERLKEQEETILELRRELGAQSQRIEAQQTRIEQLEQRRQR